MDTGKGGEGPADTHLIFLSSDDSVVYNPTNTASDFTVDLVSPLILDDHWECALTELSYDSTEVNGKTVSVFCTLCENSFVHDREKPILRRLSLLTGGEYSFTLRTPYYVPVKQSIVRRIGIYLRTGKFSESSFGAVPSTCTLHLRRTRWRI
jgi:hypothetical protein